MKIHNSYLPSDLTIVICAYKECEFLEDSIKAILEQSVSPKVKISTSTPNAYIQGIADKYGIEINVNPDGGQIKDYNYAMSLVETPLGMLAHQDDIMTHTYVEEVIRYLNASINPIIAFTDYLEMHDGIVDKEPSRIIKIKHLLLIPMRMRGATKGRYKRLCQLLGDPITHPTVTCVMKKLPEEIFREEYRASMDWDLWERLSRQKGSFVYVPKILMYHRMSEENQTVQLYKTGENIRYNEEMEIFSRFWPKCIAGLIMRFYRKAENYY